MSSVPGTPARLRGRLHERARWEWRREDGGDPLALLTEFLSGAGLAVADLSRPATGPSPDRPAATAGLPAATASLPARSATATGRPVGAAILFGAAALPPATARHHPARPSPCPGVPDAAAVVYGVAPHRRRPRPPGPAVVGPWRATWTEADHRAAVEEVRAAIGRGEVYQANLVRHRTASYEGDPAAVGAALTSLPDAPYAGGMTGPGWAVHTASPELFLQVRGGMAVTKPIKGTARRGLVHSADLAARAALRRSAKDRAEHVMIVDLARNDLARVALPGAVRVPELYAVRPLSGLWHAESTVEAALAPGTSLYHLLHAAFPGGSVTGAPKLAALEQIARIEPVGRGPSMGALGWVSADGDLMLSLTIRTMAVAGGAVHLWTGGGITWGSDPAAEVAEAEDKAAPLLAAVAARVAGARRDDAG